VFLYSCSIIIAAPIDAVFHFHDDTRNLLRITPPGVKLEVLEVRGEKPHYHGPLRLLAGPQRLETGWWDDGAQGLALRDYFIARSDEAGLLWVYRERLQPNAVRWYLQGIYA